MTALLAFDTSGERTLVALAVDGRVFERVEAGGPRASATLLPAVLSVLEEAGIELARLDAIAFGRGPGAFTGLRTACAVAQGLGFGAGKPLLPLDGLRVVAEDARAGAASWRGWSVIDARMGELYAAEYAFDEGLGWSTTAAPALFGPTELTARWRRSPADGDHEAGERLSRANARSVEAAGSVARPVASAARTVAGSGLLAFPDLDTGLAERRPDAAVGGRALLAVAGFAWDAGEAVAAERAWPLYVRDKVAQTTAEREALRGAR